MSDLLNKLKKNSTVKDSVVLKDSRLFNKKDMCTTRVPILNVALSGSLDGGLTSGLTVVAGPSKHYKSNLSLLMASAYLEKYDDAVMILYDTEFGITPEYLESFSIDPERVLHTPVEHVEQLKFDLIRQLEEIDRKDHVIVVIDSIGNIASKKELEDTLNEKSVADMSRAKQIKSLFRMCTPYLTTRDIPMIAINHTYESMGLFPTAVMSGGCLEAGTRIMMSDGAVKEIESVVPGDMVKTLDGDKEVTHSWNPETLTEGTPECYEIEFEDGHKVVCSDKHRFLVNGEWVEAKDLVEGQDVKAV